MPSARLLIPSALLVLALLIPEAAWPAFDNVSDWSDDGDMAGMLFGGVVSTAGDVNGDGHSDVLVSAPFFDGSAVGCGQVRLYLGGAGGPTLPAAWVLNGTVASGHLGASVSYAGDVNADGYDDVIVGEPGHGSGTGRARLFLGGAGGLSPIQNQVIQGAQVGQQLGDSVAGVGDINGDGYDDVAIGSPDYTNGQTREGRAQVYLGIPGGIGASAAWTKDGNVAEAYFGGLVAGAGDVNADGYDDLLVRQNSDGSGVAGVLLYMGSGSGPGAFYAWSTTATEGLVNYPSHSMAPAGDTDGDGYSDFLVGDADYLSAGNRIGRVRLFRGGASGPAAMASWTVFGSQANAGWGRAVGSAGDLNGDGFADLWFSAPGEDWGQSNEGAVHVYFGSRSGPVLASPARLEGNQAGCSFGGSAAAAGDADNDGYGDLLVGAENFDQGQTNEGAVFYFRGGGTVFASLSSWGDASNVAFAALGSSVAVGDWNGDGHSDVAAAAPGLARPGGGSGGVFIYYGSDSGLPSAPDLTLYEPGASNGFALALGNAGDTNGDGCEDLLVGSPVWNNVGQVYLFRGSIVGLNASPASSLPGTRVGERYGQVVAGAGDVNGDGYCDILIGQPDYSLTSTDRGAAYLHLGGSAGVAATAAWSVAGGSTDDRMGAALASAGDVNGDGFSDVIVGAPGDQVVVPGEGVARVYPGSATGLSTTAIWTTRGGLAYASFGGSVGCVGDVNSDGLSDLIVGAPDWSNGQADEGRAVVYLGTQTTPFWTAESNEVDARYGLRVAGAGDVNGDGFSDWVVASPWRGTSDAGSVNLYLGPAGSGGSAWISYGSATGFQRFGYAMASGDFDADGFSDLLVGAPLMENANVDEGFLYGFYGNDTRGLSREIRQAPYAPSFQPIALLGRSGLEDAVRFRMTHRTPFGRGRTRLQYDVEPLGGVFNSPVTAALEHDTGAPAGSNGSQADFSEQVDGLTAGTPYIWRARILTDSPLFPHSRWFSVIGNGRLELDFRTAPAASGVGDDKPPAAGDAPGLALRAWPNPFWGALKLHFQLPVPADVALTVYDVQGRTIWRRALGALDAGPHEAAWAGKTETGAPAAAGVYFVEASGAGIVARRKVVKVE